MQRRRPKLRKCFLEAILLELGELEHWETRHRAYRPCRPPQRRLCLPRTPLELTTLHQYRLGWFWEQEFPGLL